MPKRLFVNITFLVMGMILATLFHPFSYLGAFAQATCQTFPETGKTVCGRFLEYWQKNGGLAQQGYPISNTFSEVSDANGKTYTVQYFERSVFEMHPENQQPYDVLLSQLGTSQLKRKYPNGDPSGGAQPSPTAAAAPTAAPTAAASGPKLDMVDYTTYKPEYGGRRAVGYIRNDGSVDLGSAKVVATFKDASGKIVGTSTDSCACLLRPNDFYPFSVSQTSDGPDFTEVTFQLAYEAATEFDESFYYNDFQVSDINVIPPASYSGLKVVGTVKNTGSGTAEFASINVLITNSAGKTIDVEKTFAQIQTLGPGATSPFQAELEHATEAPNVKVAVYSFTK